jgi:hypothetical protein
MSCDLSVCSVRLVADAMHRKTISELMFQSSELLLMLQRQQQQQLCMRSRKQLPRCSKKRRN